MNSERSSLSQLLASYDDEVEEIFQDVDAAGTGTERAQVTHRLRRAISVHDSVVSSVLCPVLADLPGGPSVATKLVEGCQERAKLLVEFKKLTNGVAAHNVYASSADDVERILRDLRSSFARHETEETSAVAEVLGASETSTDPEVMAARMALAAARAPTRSHRVPLPKPLHRYMDKFHDWSDTHHGWAR